MFFNNVCLCNDVDKHNYLTIQIIKLNKGFFSFCENFDQIQNPQHWALALEPSSLTTRK
jgi:hypothetical protein